MLTGRKQLALAAESLPEYFVELVDVYESFCGGVRELPTNVFALFVSSSSPAAPLPQETVCSILRNALRHYLPAAVPNPLSLDGETDDLDGCSVAMLERCYLPFAASSVTLEMNAKMSLVLESLFRIVWVYGGITWSAGLQRALEKGVQARSDRTKARRKKARAKSDGDEDSAGVVLEKSGQRLLTMIGVLRRDTEL